MTRLLLLLILITLLGAWPFTLIIAGLLAIGWFLIWIIKNWNEESILTKNDASLEFPSWFGGDEQGWIEFQAWSLSWFYDEQNWVTQKEIPSWFGGDEKQWLKFQKWIKDRIQRINTTLQDKNDDKTSKTPSWFNGDRQQWLEFLAWNRDMITGHKKLQ